MTNAVRSGKSSSRPSSQTAPSVTVQAPVASKPADYVYFDRSTTGFSNDAIPRAKAAQLKLEHYYKISVDAAIERNTRSVLAAVLLVVLQRLTVRLGGLNWNVVSKQTS